jgi:hypothetical protein
MNADTTADTKRMRRLRSLLVLIRAGRSPKNEALAGACELGMEPGGRSAGNGAEHAAPAPHSRGRPRHMLAGRSSGSGACESIGVPIDLLGPRLPGRVLAGQWLRGSEGARLWRAVPPKHHYGGASAAESGLLASAQAGVISPHRTSLFRPLGPFLRGRDRDGHQERETVAGTGEVGQGSSVGCLGGGSRTQSTTCRGAHS